MFLCTKSHVEDMGVSGLSTGTRSLSIGAPVWSAEISGDFVKIISFFVLFSFTICTDLWVQIFPFYNSSHYMKLFAKRTLFLILLTTALFVTGCASKKKSNADADAALGSANNGGTSLELNGDSDGNKAGGLVTVYFDFNSSSLTGDTLAQLKTNAEFLKTNSAIVIQIEGHADERGGVQYNLALGEKRAKAVKDFLASSGVKAGRMTTISYGKERPVSFGHDEESWGKNRRANFVITAK